MMLARAQSLGFIPDWQFSMDPAINIKLNPHVNIPADWPLGQRTVQPIGLVPQRLQGGGDPLAATDGLTPMNGLGITRARWMEPRAGLGAFEIFDSWAWRNRKPLVLGGLGLIGLAVLAGAGAILR